MWQMCVYEREELTEMGCVGECVNSRCWGK